MIQANNAESAAARRDERLEAELSKMKEPPPSVVVPSDNEAEFPEQRRAHLRFKVELDVSLGNDQTFYVGFVENLSCGGVFIATHMLKAVGEVFELTVHLPNNASSIRGLGEVRWIREYSERSHVPPGMGVRFIKLNPGSQELVEEFLAKREPLYLDDD